MGLFLINLASGSEQGPFRNGVDAMIVSALNAVDAKAVCKARNKGFVSDAVWEAATVTELTDILANADAAMANWRFRIAILDSSPVVDVKTSTPALGVVTVAVAAGGTGYSVNDILTISGGTSTRAATARVTSVSTGAVDGVELVDPGEYTVAPATSAAATTGGGTGCTLDTTNDNDRMANHLASLVGLLNATSPIAGAAIDMGAASNPLLTVASGSGGDDLGDKKVIAEVFSPIVTETGGQRSQDVAIPGFVGTVTDEGAASAALTVAYALDSTMIVPTVKGGFTFRE